MVFKISETYIEPDERIPTHYRIRTVIAEKNIFTQLEELVTGLIIFVN